VADVSGGPGLSIILFEAEEQARHMAIPRGQVTPDVIANPRIGPP